MADGHEGPATGSLYRLFSEAKKGSAASRDELLTALRPRIFRFILRRVGGAVAAHEVAEDLTQDVLLRIHDGLPGCEARSEAQLVAWAFTIARHVVIDWRRKRTLEEETPGDAPAPSLGTVVEGALEGPSPEDRLLGELLFAAQATLSPGTQEVIRQRLLYGATWRVAGEAIGTTAGGAKRRWQRALVRLEREILQQVGNIRDAGLRRAVLDQLSLDDG